MTRRTFTMACAFGVSVASACDEPTASRCRTYASMTVDSNALYERTMECNEDESTFTWDEYIEEDWWSGTIRYRSATEFIEEAEVFGRRLVAAETAVAEIGGLDHQDVYSYDATGRLVEIRRTTRDIVESHEVTRFLDFDAKGRPTRGVHDYTEEDVYSCLGAEVEIHYDDVARSVTGTTGTGTDMDSEECGRVRATREVHDEEHLLVGRSLWFSTNDVTSPPDREFQFQNTATSEVCVD